MMKRLNVLILMCLAAVSLVSCRGNVDPDGPGGVPEGTLRIFADRDRIKADGQESVTFTVMYGSKDVSNDVNMNIIRMAGDNELLLKGGVNTFATESPAEYVFKARYYEDGAHYTDNTVRVIAEQVAQGGQERNYVRKFWGMQFTAVSCTYCPDLSSAIDAVMSEMPGKIVLTSFHVAFQEGQMPDPMRLDQNEMFRDHVKLSDGLPLFAFNMLKPSVNPVTVPLIKEEMDRVGREYPATCGVAISASCAEGVLKVSAHVTSNVRENFRYHMILVEDGIEGYAQAGADGPYVHDNVVRKVLSGSKWGDDMNQGMPLEVGVEVTVERDVRLDDSWNPDNMRAVFVAMTSEDGGNTFICNNVNECEVGAASDYEYEEL